MERETSDYGWTFQFDHDGGHEHNHNDDDDDGSTLLLFNLSLLSASPGRRKSISMWGPTTTWDLLRTRDLVPSKPLRPSASTVSRRQALALRLVCIVVKFYRH